MVFNIKSDLWEKLNDAKKSLIFDFIEKRKNDKGLTTVGQMDFVGNLMKFVSDTILSGNEKKSLVESIYQSISNLDSNDFSVDFKIGDAIEFIYSTSKDQYGIQVHKVGMVTKLFKCVTSCQKNNSS